MTDSGTLPKDALPCGAKDLGQWQSYGFDKGGKLTKTPPVDVIMAMAKALLDF
jgi:hypothetical protein